MVLLSLVIPAFAEAKYLAGTLEAIWQYLADRDLLTRAEVIVVTADAGDGTADIARRELARFPLAQHLEPGAKVGKGRDVRCGMLAARGEIVVFMDADLATPLPHIDEAIAKIREGHDVVIGCRDLARMHRSVGRRIRSQLSIYLVRALLLPAITDTQCGFKAFHRSIVAELFEPLTTLGWGFDLEVLTRARGAGASIAELAISDWCDPKGDDGLVGETPWLAMLRTLRELVMLVLRHGRQGVAANPRRKPRIPDQRVVEQPSPIVEQPSPIVEPSPIVAQLSPIVAQSSIEQPSHAEIALAGQRSAGPPEVRADRVARRALRSAR